MDTQHGVHRRVEIPLLADGVGQQVALQKAHQRVGVGLWQPLDNHGHMLGERGHDLLLVGVQRRTDLAHRGPPSPGPAG